MSSPESTVITEVRGRVGLITLNRPKALNALSLEMERAISAALLAWRDDGAVLAVAIRGTNKEGPFGAFCAGGDIRFFHQAALAGDPSLEDFFTEEYALNHLIHTYPKPYIAFLDGIVMGGGMGISGHGAGHSLRIVTPRSKLAMPETHIGLFPDVGGGHFLSRCEGQLGEYLALTGAVIHGEDAAMFGLADRLLPAEQLPALWERLGALPHASSADVLRAVDVFCRESGVPLTAERAREIDQAYATLRERAQRHFAHASMGAIVASLEADGSEWAQATAHTLRQRSPLMCHVVLEQVRRARTMTLAQALRLERDLVRHCFFTRHLGRSGASSETVEGVRALAVDKDHSPRWNPARFEDVTPAMWQPFFDSPWPVYAHPLRELA